MQPSEADMEIGRAGWIAIIVIGVLAVAFMIYRAKRKNPPSRGTG
jgi:cbb3-type cytochrome oxidase subunit 3